MPAKNDSSQELQSDSHAEKLEQNDQMRYPGASPEVRASAVRAQIVTENIVRAAAAATRVVFAPAGLPLPVAGAFLHQAAGNLAKKLGQRVGDVVHAMHESKSTSIQIRVHPNETQSVPGMSKPVCSLSISDGTNTIRTKDPLEYLVSHIDTINDFTICIEDAGKYKDISLPPHIRKNILTFIKTHKNSSEWNCEGFAAAAHGLYEEGSRIDYHSWNISPPLGEAKLAALKPGDFIGMEGGGTDGHAVLYLGEGLYLSKLGFEHGLTICRLEDMQKPYQRLSKYTPKFEALAQSQNEAPPTDYRIGAPAQQQPRPAESQWNPLTMLIPAILRSELQASETSETSSGQSSQEVKYMRPAGQYCTTNELAMFLRKQTNLSATITEAKAFGMPDWMLEKVKSSGLITVSDGKLLLSPEAFSKQFPRITASVEEFDLLTLDRKHQSFRTKEGVSAEQVHEYLIPKLKLFARNQHVTIDEVIIHHDQCRYEIKFSRTVDLTGPELTKSELLAIAETKETLGLWEAAAYHRQDAAGEIRAPQGARFLRQVKTPKPTPLTRTLAEIEHFFANHKDTTTVQALEEFGISRGMIENFRDPENGPILIQFARENGIEQLKFSHEAFCNRYGSQKILPDGSLWKLSSQQFIFKKGISYEEGYEIALNEVTEAIKPHLEIKNFRLSPEGFYEFECYPNPVDINKTPEELYHKARSLEGARKWLGAQYCRQLAERVAAGEVLSDSVKKAPVIDIAPQQPLTARVVLTETRAQPKTLSGILSLLELQNKTEFTLAELKEFGISADRLHKWRLGNNPILQSVDGNKTLKLDLEHAHRRLRSKIEYPGKGTLYLHQKLFIPAPGFESQAEAFFTNEYHAMAKRENLLIRKLVYCPKTFAFRAEYFPFQINEIKIGNETTAHIYIAAATQTKTQCYAVAEQKAGAGFWLSQDYNLQIAEIAETPGAKNIGENLLRAISDNGEPGHLLAVSEQNSKSKPLVQGKSEKLGTLPHAFDEKTRTLMLSDALSKADVNHFMKQYSLKQIASVTLRVGFGRVLPAIGIVLSTANIVHAAEGEKVKVAAKEGALFAAGTIGSTATALGAVALGCVPGLTAVVAGGVILSEAVAHRMRPETVAPAMHHNHMPRFKSLAHDQAMSTTNRNWPKPDSFRSLQLHSELEKTTDRYLYAITADGKFKYSYAISNHAKFISGADVIAAGEIIFTNGKCIVNNKSKEYRTCGPQIAPFVLEKLSQMCDVENAEFHYLPGTQYLEREKLPDNCVLPKALPSGTPQDRLFQRAPESTVVEDALRETVQFFPQMPTSQHSAAAASSSAQQSTSIYLGVFIGDNGKVEIVPVFRGTVSPPSKIHSKGFARSGDNFDLDYHLFPNDAPEGYRDPYISTSSSKDVAFVFAKKDFKVNVKNQVAFIYEIDYVQPDAVDVVETIRQRVEKGLSDHYPEYIKKEKEIAIPREIKPKNIKGAWTVKTENVRIEDGFETCDLNVEAFTPNVNYRTPAIVTAAKIIKRVGYVATAIGVALDGMSLTAAYNNCVKSGNFERFFDEATRVLGAWSVAIAAGAPCAKAGLTLGAPGGPWGSLAGAVILGAAGSIAAYHVGGEAARAFRKNPNLLLPSFIPTVFSSQLHGATNLPPAAYERTRTRGVPLAREIEDTTKRATTLHLNQNHYERHITNLNASVRDRTESQRQHFARMGMPEHPLKKLKNNTHEWHRALEVGKGTWVEWMINEAGEYVSLRLPIVRAEASTKPVVVRRSNSQSQSLRSAYHLQRQFLDEVNVPARATVTPNVQAKAILATARSDASSHHVSSTNAVTAHLNAPETNELRLSVREANRVMQARSQFQQEQVAQFQMQRSVEIIQTSGELFGLASRVCRYAGNNDTAQFLSSTFSLFSGFCTFILSGSPLGLIMPFISFFISNRAAEAARRFAEMMEAASRSLGDLHQDVMDALNEFQILFQKEIRYTGALFAEILAEQNNCHRLNDLVFNELATLENTMSKHFENTNAYLHVLKTRNLKTICDNFHSYLNEPFGVQPSPKQIQKELHDLEFWIMSRLHHPQMNGAGYLNATSGEAASILLQQQYPLITMPSFFASRVYCALGETISPAVLSLPPMPLYFSAIELFCKVLEKHPEFLSKNKAEAVFAHIQETLTTYGELIQFIKTNEVKIRQSQLPAQEKEMILKPLANILVYETAVAEMKKVITDYQKRLQFLTDPVQQLEAFTRAFEQKLEELTRKFFYQKDPVPESQGAFWKRTSQTKESLSYVIACSEFEGRDALAYRRDFINQLASHNIKAVKIVGQPFLQVTLDTTVVSRIMPAHSPAFFKPANPALLTAAASTAQFTQP